MLRVTRRDFLHTAALAGAGAIVNGCARRSSPAVHDVVVLGAGMAGLSATRDLVRAGLDVVLLEARERVGGRMHTLFEPAPHGIEVGAQMIHGTRASTWALVREFGVETRPLGGRWNRWEWRPGRGFLRPDRAREERIRARLEKGYRAYRGEDISYKQFLDSLKFTPEEQDAVSEYALSWSAEPDEMSLRAAMEDTAAWDAYLDQNYQVVGGYLGLTQKLAGKFMERVRLNSPVSAVQWGRDGVVVAHEREGRAETLRARRAVITLPVGVLQRGQPAFSPGLPEWKERAIQSLRMGTVVVLHFLFDDWFWRDLAPSVPGWQARGGRISFYDPHPPGKGLPVLAGWITGQAARELSDLGQEAGLRTALSWIEEALPRSGASRRVQWSSMRDWIRDPYAFGSYSFALPNGNAQRAVLATPVQDRLYFAGEATEPAPHYQTVHGAYSSGRRAAREILAALGMDVAASFPAPARGPGLPAPAPLA